MSYTNATLRRLQLQLLRKHRSAFKPRGEGAHVRSVVPGKFAAEVSEEAASKLRQAHRDWWQALGYAA